MKNKHSLPIFIDVDTDQSIVQGYNGLVCIDINEDGDGKSVKNKHSVPIFIDVDTDQSIVTLDNGLVCID
ncbi:hypothetical protein PSZ44_23880, partial [Shigella flexneri]|nr:hypothetical protein [Shigella flexneri]